MANSTPRHAGAKSPAEKSETVVGFNRNPRTRRSKKPSFPLWLHPTGQWGKKIHGRYFYFGKHKDAALKEYLRVKDDLEAGRTPQPAESERVTLLYAVNAFLTHQKHKVQTGEITIRTFADYHNTCELMLKHLGKTLAVEQIRPDDLLAYRRKLAETRNATTVGNEVNRTRVVLRFAFENGLIDRPVRFGGFKRPSKGAMRRERTTKGPVMFEASPLRQLLEAGSGQLRAMILLGINCGFGNTDITTLPLPAVDLDAGWIDYPRPKTGIQRRCPLWPETVQALRLVMATRKTPKDAKDAAILFISQRAEAWASGTKGSTGLTHEFRKLLNKLGLHRRGVGFYVLRHTFQTIADEVGDYIATRRIMGHADNSISDHYRERFPDDRLRRVAEHVRSWLFTASEPATKTPGPSSSSNARHQGDTIAERVVG